MDKQFLLIYALTFIIHIIATLAYSLRIAGRTLLWGTSGSISEKILSISKICAYIHRPHYMHYKFLKHKYTIAKNSPPLLPST
ncbi:hypothetical protein D3C87_782110 [compost metagenome]